MSARIHRRPRPRPRGGRPPKRPRSMTDAQDGGSSGTSTRCGGGAGKDDAAAAAAAAAAASTAVGSGMARLLRRDRESSGGRGGRTDPRGCPGAIVRGGRRSHVDVVGALPCSIHQRVDHARRDHGPESVPPPSSSSSSSLPMVVVVRLLLPPRRGAAVHRRRRHIHGGRGREQRHQLVDLRVHSSLEGDAPCHLPFQLVHARQEAPTVSCPSSSHTRCSSTTSSLFFVMSSSRRRLNIAWRE